MITVVVFIHNLSQRGSCHYLRNMLHSLRCQTTECNIIVVDTSNDGWYDQIRDLCQKYKVIHLVAPEKTNTWNMSRAFNAGIVYANKAIKSEYVMTTGMDFIFAKNFLEVASKSMSPKNLVLCQVHDVYRDLGMFNMSKFNSVLSRSKLHDRAGCGACQLSSVSWILSIGGYDERLKLWGTVDNDMVKRAELSGLKIKWLSETNILNQWHPKYKNLIPIAKSQKKINRHIYLSSNSVNRNQGLQIGNISYSSYDWRQNEN